MASARLYARALGVRGLRPRLAPPVIDARKDEGHSWSRAIAARVFGVLDSPVAHVDDSHSVIPFGASLRNMAARSWATSISAGIRTWALLA